MTTKSRAAVLAGLITALLLVGATDQASAALVTQLSDRSNPASAAAAAGRCSTSTGSAADRVGIFWQCVNSLSSADYLLAEDLGQWGHNVSELDPGACISVSDFKGATAGMQTALDSASAGIPPSPPKSPDVEGRISTFWQKVGALSPGDFLAAPDLGQWAINVIDRDPSRRIRVDDFRISTATMQAAFDRSKAAGVSCKSVTVRTPPPGMSFVSGRATDAATGAPLSVFDVMAYPVAAGAVSNSGFYAPGGADGNGGYFVSLLPGTYRVSFKLLGYTTQWWKNAPSGAGATDVVIPSAGLTITGIDAALVRATTQASPSPSARPIGPCSAPCVWADKTTMHLGETYVIHLDGYAPGTGFAWQFIDPQGVVGALNIDSVYSTADTLTFVISTQNGASAGQYRFKVTILDTNTTYYFTLQVVP